MRVELDGGHMDVHVSDNASPETLAALRALGQAAVNRMTVDPNWYCWDCGVTRALEDFPDPCACGGRAITSSPRLADNVRAEVL